MRHYRIIQNLDETDPPRDHEKSAAKILAEYFKSDLIFIRKGPSSTPDLKVIKTGQMWELKSPIGDGKRTMANNIREASIQSKNVVIDLSRCKMNNQNALSRIRGFLSSGNVRLKRLLVIDKSGEVIDFLPNKR